MDHFKAVAVQGVQQHFQLGSLAAAVRPFHGQEGAADAGHVRAQHLRDFPRGMGQLLRAGGKQLLFAAVSVGDAQGMDPGFAAAFHIKLPVTHHPGFPIPFRQGIPDHLFLFRLVARGAKDGLKVRCDPEMLQDPLRRLLRLSGNHAHVDPGLLQAAQRVADSGIHPVLKQAHIVVALPVDGLRLQRLFLRHPRQVLKGPHQRRTDKLPQRRRVRLRKSHLCQRMPGTVPDSLFRLGQRPVQIKQNPHIRSTKYH